MSLINNLNDDNLLRFCRCFSHDPRVSDLLEKLLFKPLKRLEGQNWERYYDPVTHFPAKPPLWLSLDKFNQTDFYKFNADKAHAVISREISHISDWIESAIHNNDSWINNIDYKGTPKRFSFLDTLEKITQAADKDMRQKINDLRSNFNGQSNSLQTEVGTGNIRVEHDYGDGFYLVELLTPNALDKESVQLGHCIGNGGFDEHLKTKASIFYSLRDHNNHAHATLDVANNSIIQCRGKQNQPPTPYYIPYIQSYIKQKALKLEESPTNTGLIEENGEYFSVNHLPDPFIYHGDLDLNNCDWLTQLPSNLFVTGSLYLQHCVNLTKLPNHLSVGKDLDLYNCRSITNLPEHLNIGGNLKASKTCIKELPKHLNVGKSMIFFDCSDLTTLPEYLNVRNDLILSGCKRLTNIPPNLSVKRSLDLSDCCSLTSIGENLNVGKNLTLRLCTNLKKIPKNMDVKEDITWKGRSYSLAEFREKFEEKQQKQPTAPPMPEV